MGKKALDLLSRREHTRRELFEKLSARGFDSDLIDAVINELADKNLQSDIRFAELFVEQRINKGFGKQKIRAELRDRGVDADLAKDTLAANEVDWIGLARRVITKKFGEYDGVFSAKNQMKCKRYLHSRGFNHGQISVAISQWSRQKDECE